MASVPTPSATPVLSSANSEATRRLGLSPWVVVLALGLLTGLQPLTTDLYLPAVPQMQRALALSPATAQWTLSVLVLAFGIGQLAWGPISDHVGRRPVLRWGLALYVLASLATVLAPDLTTMLLARIAQGACLSAAVVCGRAMVHDLYPPEQGARVMAQGLTGLGVLALLGPVVGGITAAHGGWRVTLATLVLAGLLISVFVWRCLPETLPPGHRQARLDWMRLLGQWRGISAHPTFRAHALLTASTYGGLYVWLALSPFVFLDLLHVGSTPYGLIMASLSLAYLGGTLVCRRMLIRFGLLGSVRMAGVCSASAGLWMLGISVWQATRAEPVPAASLLPGLWLYCLAHGVHQPCGQTGVVAAFPGMAGAASALSGFVLAAAAFAIGALLSAWSSLPGWAGTLYPMTLGMALGGVCTAWTALRRVQREGLPPEALG